ncbi:hypothetical protein JCM11957_02170 [Caminibacter profundus]
MKYYEFRDAARKHFKVCECLYERCNEDCLKNWLIKEEIYYLLGYVVEMGLKYIKLKQIGEGEIEDLDFDNGEEIKSFFRSRGENIKFFTHDITYLMTLINEIEVNFESLEKIKVYFADKWNIYIRYHCNENKYCDVRKDLDEIYKEVKKFLEYCYKI